MASKAPNFAQDMFRRPGRPFRRRRRISFGWVVAVDLALWGVIAIAIVDLLR